MKVDISIPVNINENNLDKYNKSSDYYNNICSKTTSDNGIDIPLSDRKNNFVENNLTLCEEDCGLVNFNTTTKKAKCSCLVKISLPLIDEIKFDKDKLYKSFTDIKNFANINLLKCYKNVLNFDSIKKNFGAYFYIMLLLLFFICLFLFYFKYYSSLEKIIMKISEAKNKIFNKNKKRNNNLIITNNNNLNRNKKVNKNRIKRIRKVKK